VYVRARARMRVTGFSELYDLFLGIAYSVVFFFRSCYDVLFIILKIDYDDLSVTNC